MKNILKAWLLLCFIGTTQLTLAQDQPVFSGNLEANFNVFLRDSLINATNTPQYDSELMGGEVWLNIMMAYQGFEIGGRFDMFNNSNLLNPTGSYTGQGLGMWFVRKKINKFGLEVGYIYDQVGSGIIYRAFEQRPLLIDNALEGAKLTYDISEDWQIKAFTGKQKFLFGTNPGIIRGAAIDGFLRFGSEESPITLTPGAGVVNRTLDDESLQRIVDDVRNYRKEEQVTPVYNVYLFSLYNTLNYKNITWYFEGAYKTPEAFNDPRARRQIGGISGFGRFRKEAGTVFYSSLSYSQKGLGITVEGKRTENFNFRSDPNLTLNRGLVNWIPPMNRVNTYRMTARYAPATQDLSELAYQLDVRYKFNKKWSVLVNHSRITELDGNLLYTEYLAEVLYKYKRTWQLTAGLQLQEYNQSIYETKPGVDNVMTVTPYLDFLYKFNRKNSIRFETQYMNTEQDFGSWIFALVEYSIAPKWIFETSMMYNVSPTKKSPQDADGNLLKIAYPTLGVVYINKSNRFSLRYVKQVEGIVCSGGICRLEPAFSGVRFNVTSNF